MKKVGVDRWSPFSSNKAKLGKGKGRWFLVATTFLASVEFLQSSASAAAPDRLLDLDPPLIDQSWQEKVEELRVKKAEKVIGIQSERSPLTLESKEELIKYYATVYMPKKGCSLTEDLPADSDIHYVKPKPKSKPKQKSNPSRGALNPSFQIRKGESIALTKEERKWLEKLVEAEAGGEPYRGKLAVATVIANRVESPIFPDTVMEVIKANNGERHQFSPWDDGRIYEVEPSSATKRAVSEVFDHGKRILSPDVVYFAMIDVAFRDWMGKTRRYVTTIGNHAFFSAHPKT